jgi:hypothetical protein
VLLSAIVADAYEVTKTAIALAVASVTCLALTVRAVVPAVIGPLGWLFSLWTGDPSRSMSDQVPGFVHHGSFIKAGVVVAALALIFYIGGRERITTRIAIALTGLSVYLLMLSIPVSYTVGRAMLSVVALSLIFCSRLVRKVKPIKTILFFTGVAFTTESLLSSLATSTATLVGFAMFSATAALFARIDTKHHRRVRCAWFSAMGATVFVGALITLNL